MLLPAQLATGELLKLGALGVAVVLLVLGGIYVLAKRDVFAPSSENRETAEQRIEDAELRERSGFEIPLRSRISSIGAPGKAVLAASALIAVFMGYLGMKYLQTGSPAEQLTSLELMVAGVALAGIIGGARLQRWAESRVGRLYNVYEDADGQPEVETVEFYKHEMRSTGQDTVIQQLHPQRLLGIFRRRMLIGMHRQLRSSPKPLTDVVTHALPHGGHAFEVDDGLLINLTRGEPIYQSSPTSVADVHYRSPNTLSYERAVGIQQSKERMRIERDAWQTTSAAKDAELERLSEVIVNREWQDKQELLGILREYESMKRENTANVEDRRQTGISRSAGADGSSVLSEHPEGERNGHRGVEQ